MASGCFPEYESLVSGYKIHEIQCICKTIRVQQFTVTMTVNSIHLKVGGSKLTKKAKRRTVRLL